jgi:EAL domain-containing protein (putative c-di-GMP-specific phosphodiesterase class I)
VEEDIMTFIDNANIARKSVKGNSTTICKFYDVEMQNKIKKEIEITNSMEGALKNKEFLVFLQPKVNLGDNKLVGAEALVRWERGNHTVLPPNDFIPLFEKNGFILQLDFYIYEEVCKLIHHWITEGMPVVPISVNVSRVHLNDEHFVEKVKRLVNKYFIPPKYIELELTESMFLNNTEIAISTMKELRKLGFGVSIDDFGAGYSSLNLLKDMTTDVLKLDKEFFRQGDMQKEEQIIVSSIISMAKQLNMKVLSEGVETKMQSDFLKSISCDMAQGYLYAKPMPITQFETLLLGNADSLVRDAI